MSGHSKWSTIKHKKGAADAKRGKLFTKLSRSILVAAKEGGPDPATNMALANAIEKARSYSMPKDNIDRAIAKGSGEGTDGAIFETVVYEGYGPEGVAVLVEALTDNRNRTAADVRHLFSKHGGNLGATGCGRLAVRAPWDRARARRRRRRGRAVPRGRRRRRRRRRAGRLRLPGLERSRSALGGAPGRRGGRVHRRVGRALDGAEGDRRDRGRADREEGRAARRRRSRTTTTSRTSTRTSTSPRPCSKPSRRSGIDRRAGPRPQPIAYPACREGSRHRPRDGCVRLRDRPRKRRAGHGTRVGVLDDKRPRAAGASAAA